MSLTYKDAGVDIAAADAFVERIQKATQSTFDGKVVPATDAFAGLIRAPVQGMQQPLIAASCDGVGTKLLLGQATGLYRGLGQDLVAMNVNDLLPVGAQPLLFLDYIATGKLEPEALTQVVEGAADACRQAGCVLLGGETAEMPDLYRPGEFDLAGFAVGLVDEARLPKGDLQPGDRVVGLASSGIHSNGYSLARRALLDVGKLDLKDTPQIDGKPLGATLGETLLIPTEVYVTRVLELQRTVSVKASAHITGGGLLGRAEKLAGKGMGLKLNESYPRPTIFSLIQKTGNVTDHEMARTFNMGLGYLAVIPPVDQCEAALPAPWLEVGEVTAELGVNLGYARSDER